MPDDWNAFKAIHATEALSIEKNDPELFQLLSGTAPAALRADALEGNFSAKAPDPAVRAEDHRKKEAMELRERFAELSMTDRMYLASIDPKAYEAEMAKLETPTVGDQVQAQIRRQQELAQQRAQSANHSQDRIRAGQG
nr:hypothetical protein 10 [Alphaproteobacteria bacterium]